MTFRALVVVASIPALTACFATLQTAKVEDGLNFGAGAAVLADQTRDGRTQGTDVFLFLVPSYGVGGDAFVKLQFLAPLGIYWEEGLGVADSGGTEATTLLFQQQVKLGFNQSRDDKLALLLELNWFVIPGSLTLIYSHDLRQFTPYVAVKRLFTCGAAGDDPVITRYQETNQSLWALALGAQLATEPSPAIELGVLRNSHVESREPQSVTLYDLFVGVRMGF